MEHQAVERPSLFSNIYKQHTKMAQIYTSLIELIGNTPLLEAVNIERAKDLKARLLVKIESFNPGGSVKDRAALSMIEDAEKNGILKPGAVIIEPTSGNTGIGLAWVGSLKGYKVILTMPETMSQERRNLLKAYGAELILTPGSEGMSGAIKRAEELRDSTPGAVILQQFNNPSNPEAHVKTTAEEIWRDTERNKGGSGRTRRLARAVGRQTRSTQDTGHRSRIRAPQLQSGNCRQRSHRDQR